MRNVGKNNFMRKLALSDEILLKISQPARYIGGEVNMVKKDPSKVAVRFAMCFPDVYEIGMSHLGIQILYDMFNRRDDVYCERVYSPWMDLDPIMREQKIPLFAVESQDPIKKFDFLGITIQYEMCYTNILQVLELSQIPLHAEDRTEEDPIVIGGGITAARKYILPSLLAEMRGSLHTFSGETLPRVQMKVYDLDDATQFAAFAQGDSRRIKVYGSDREIVYDPQKRIGVMTSHIGASRAISLGAYAFALNSIDRDAR